MRLGAIALLAAILAAATSAAQADGVPAQCLTVNVSPYTAPQPLDITGPGHKPVHFAVEIAATSPRREQGLMCRSQMDDGAGMLFEFDRPAEQNFWMHDTLIGLDILYIGPDGVIVSIVKDAKPLDDTPLSSNGAANGVLEINAGLADRLGLQPGDRVTHPFFATGR